MNKMKFVYNKIGLWLMRLKKMHVHGRALGISAKPRFWMCMSLSCTFNFVLKMWYEIMQTYIANVLQTNVLCIVSHLKAIHSRDKDVLCIVSYLKVEKLLAYIQETRILCASLESNIYPKQNCKSGSVICQNYVTLIQKKLALH